MLRFVCALAAVALFAEEEMICESPEIVCEEYADEIVFEELSEENTDEIVLEEPSEENTDEIAYNEE